MENVLLGVRLQLAKLHVYVFDIILTILVLPGFTVTCPGDPGHGSRFIKNTAVNKVVSCLTVVVCTCILYYRCVLQQKILNSLLEYRKTQEEKFVNLHSVVLLM